MDGMWLRRLRYFIRQRQAEDDLLAELEFHREMKQRELEATGLRGTDAGNAAKVAMGNMLLAREDARAVWMWFWFDTARRNLLHGARILRNSPTFAATSMLTLGLCIGANGAIYALVDWTLLRPLQFPAIDRLAWVQTYAEQGGRINHMQAQNGRAFRALVEQATGVDVGAMGGTLTVNLVSGDRAIAVEQQRLSASMFEVLGIRPLIGRTFSEDEDRDGGPTAVVLSYGMWRTAFGGNGQVVGTRILLRGEPYTVVGVMPERFRTNNTADIWTPLRASIAGEGGGNNYMVLARLREHVEWPAATADIDAIGREFFTRVSPAPGVTRRFELVPIQQAMTSALRQPLLILWGAVFVVLLIGCVNLAGLQLARAIRRTPEIATRVAVGGGRAAIVLQLLAENLVIAIGGGIIGLGVGQLILRVFSKEIADVFPEAIRLDSRVFVFTAGVSLLTTLGFGLIPALKASRVDVRSMMVQGVTIGGEARRARRLIVVSELALAVVLLVGAGLFVRTFEHFQALQPGFDGRDVITATASLQDVRYETSASLNRLFDLTLTRIRQLPGVEGAAVGLTMPYERALNNPWRRPDDPPGRAEIINLTYVTPEYFRTLGMPIVRGRGFAESDGADAPPVVVVNQAFVRRYKLGDAVLGYDLDPARHTTVIGVVGDVPQINGGLSGFEPIDSIPGWYIPAAQAADSLVKTVHTWFSPSWVVRSSRPAAGLAAEMQRALEDVDPQLPFNKFRTVDDLRAEALRLPRTAAMLFGALAGLAVLLSAIGLYGIVATSIGDRLRELGLRIALGANPRQTVVSASWPGVVMSVAGIGAGLLLARAAATLVRSLIWGVQPTDPLTFYGAAGITMAIAMGAVLIPTIRVLSLNPVEALRR
jgi:predicted permease